MGRPPAMSSTLGTSTLYSKSCIPISSIISIFSPSVDHVYPCMGLSSLVYHHAAVPVGILYTNYAHLYIFNQRRGYP